MLPPDAPLESPNDNETLSPLLEVVDNLEIEGTNLNISQQQAGQEDKNVDNR